MKAAAVLAIALATGSSAALAAAGAARAQGSPILPGYWDSTEHYSVLLPGGGHARKCLTEAQIESFVAAPSNSHYRCTYARHDIADGQARYRGGSCYSHKSGRKVLSNVSVDGRYAPQSFHLSFHFDLQVSAGIGLPGSAEIDAHRIAAQCPADGAPAH